MKANFCFHRYHPHAWGLFNTQGARVDRCICWNIGAWTPRQVRGIMAQRLSEEPKRPLSSRYFSGARRAKAANPLRTAPISTCTSDYELQMPNARLQISNAATGTSWHQKSATVLHCDFIQPEIPVEDMKGCGYLSGGCLALVLEAAAKFQRGSPLHFTPLKTHGISSPSQCSCSPG